MRKKERLARKRVLMPILYMPEPNAQSVPLYHRFCMPGVRFDYSQLVVGDGAANSNVEANRLEVKSFLNFKYIKTFIITNAGNASVRESAEIGSESELKQNNGLI